MKLQIGQCLLDLDRGTFQRAGELISLRPKTYALLAHFARNPDRLLTKDELLEAIWPSTTVTEESLTQCVRDLRKAIGDMRQETIRTVTRRGYLFHPPDSAVAQTPTATGRLAQPLVAVLPLRGNTGEGTVGACGARWGRRGNHQRAFLFSHRRRLRPALRLRTGQGAG